MAVVTKNALQLEYLEVVLDYQSSVIKTKAKYYIRVMAENPLL